MTFTTPVDQRHQQSAHPQRNIIRPPLAISQLSVNVSLCILAIVSHIEKHYSL